MNRIVGKVFRIGDKSVVTYKVGTWYYPYSPRNSHQLEGYLHSGDESLLVGLVHGFEVV